MISASKTNKKFLFVLIAAAYFWAPSFTFAAVQITEVMYDPPGANAGNQWVEITNVGDAPVNIFGYRLAEGGANHKISIVAGMDSTSSPQATTLAANASAIVANDPDTFASNYPNYSGALFKSAFSLPSKSGGTIALKDAKLATLDTVSYDPSAGAAGDGNSLHRSGSALVVGAPNPGSVAATAPLVPAAQTSGTSAKTPAATSVASSKTNAVLKNKSSSPNTSTYNAPNQNMGAASPLLSQLNLPQGPLAWSLGGLGLLLVGISGIWYLRLRSGAYRRNVLSAEEFDIE